MGLTKQKEELLSKEFREPLAIIFAIMLTAFLTNANNKFFLAITATTLLLLLATFAPSIKKKYACLECHGSGKKRCSKLCDRGYFGPIVGTYTATIQLDNFFINIDKANEASLIIKKLDFTNHGRTGDFSQTVVVQALNEGVGNFSQKFTAEPYREVGWKNVDVKLHKYPWLVKELGRGPSDKMFHVTVSYEPLTKGDKCNGCENGFVKCNKCFRGIMPPWQKA